jgi:hypothetical protein
MKNKHKIFACFLVCIMILSLPIHITAGIKPVKINYEKKTIEIGQKTQLKLKNAKNKVFWETKDKKIATVTTKGMVCAKSCGRTLISAHLGFRTYQCVITVISPKGETLILNDNILNLKVGDNYIIKWDVYPLQKSIKKKKITWMCADPNVAFVTEEGIVVARKSGKTIVSGKVDQLSASCVVNVSEPQYEYRKKAQSIISNEITSDMDDYTKIMKLYQWMENNLQQYDYSEVAKKNIDDLFSNWEHTESIGVAKSYKVLLDLAGIENRVVEFTENYCTDRYVNAVKIDGNWYWIDIFEKYFLVTDDILPDKWEKEESMDIVCNDDKFLKTNEFSIGIPENIDDCSYLINWLCDNKAYKNTARRIKNFDEFYAKYEMAEKGQMIYYYVEGNGEDNKGYDAELNFYQKMKGLGLELDKDYCVSATCMGEKKEYHRWDDDVVFWIVAKKK